MIQTVDYLPDRPSRPEIQRDHWGRPMVVPLDGGKLVAYTRCTTFIDAIDDKYNLARWQIRMAMLGLADRRDLQLAVAAHREDKQRLNQIAESAIEAAQGRVAATTGTALHAITETHDRGNEVGVLPEDAQADLDAYVAATHDLTPILIEHFTVLDALKIGGTPDRVARFHDGKRYIVDLKTGSLEHGALKIAAQLAVYSRSRPYDVATGRRLEPHGADLERGIVVHLPAGHAVCRLYWVDLTAGWEVVQLARRVREKRSLPFRSLMSEISGPDPTTPVLTLADQIASAASPEAVRDLWRAHEDAWNDELTQLAKQHIDQLAQQGSVNHV